MLEFNVEVAGTMAESSNSYDIISPDNENNLLSWDFFIVVIDGGSSGRCLCMINFAATSFHPS
jgi:hypothetical protein